MTPSQIKVQRILCETPRFRVVEVHQRTRDGKTVPRQVVLHPGAAVIVPILQGMRVCLIRNERPAVAKTLIELPAGTIDPPEDPRTTAIRELQEETGYTAASWRELPAFYMSPGILQERMHVFVAEGLTEGETAHEPGETIDKFIVPWAEALSMIDRGEIEDAKTICALLMWERMQPR